MKFFPFNQRVYMKSRREKRRDKKTRLKNIQKKKKTLVKRGEIREEANIEKEMEKIRYISRDKPTPYRKPKI